MKALVEIILAGLFVLAVASLFMVFLYPLIFDKNKKEKDKEKERSAKPLSEEDNNK